MLESFHVAKAAPIPPIAVSMKSGFDDAKLMIGMITLPTASAMPFTLLRSPGRSGAMFPIVFPTSEKKDTIGSLMESMLSPMNPEASEMPPCSASPALSLISSNWAFILFVLYSIVSAILLYAVSVAPAESCMAAISSLNS